MKKAILISMIVAVFAFLSVSSIHAQVSDVYKANIPFDFSVGKKQYPAGLYSVEIRGIEKKFFVFRDSRGGSGYIMNTLPGKGISDETAALDFKRVGTSYYLRSIQARELMSSLPVSSSNEGLALKPHETGVIIRLANGK